MNRKTEAFKKENLIILGILLLVFLITLGFYIYFSVLSLIDEEIILNNTVVRIIDGDTFEIASGEKVRMLCIDTPEENQKGYEEAKRFLSDLILGKQVRLEKEISDKDKYGRLLRYVYVNQSGTPCVAEENSNSSIISGEICFSIGNSEEIFVNREIILGDYGSLFVYGADKCSELI